MLTHIYASHNIHITSHTSHSHTYTHHITYSHKHTSHQYTHHILTYAHTHYIHTYTSHHILTHTHISHHILTDIHTSYHIHTYTSHTYTHRDIMTGAREMAQQVKGLLHKHEPLSADSPATRNRKVDMEDTVCSHTAGWIPRAQTSQPSQINEIQMQLD